MRRAAILIMIAAFFVSGCSSQTEEPGQLYSGMNLESLPGYRAVFNMTFEGESLWSYHLGTQASGEAYAYQLSLEGLGPLQDPGDVRLVHSEGTNRMRGEGTDDECVQFPDSNDIGMLFLTPDEIFDPNMLDAPMVAFEEDEVAGQETLHYSLQQSDLLTWQNISLDLWISVEDGTTLRYELSADGPDPLFSGGEGHLVGQFEVIEIATQSIDPVEGCQIDFPLPDDHAELIRLPDLLAFESERPPEDLAGWYQTALEQAGWEPFAERQTSSTGVQLSYQRGTEQVQIKITASDDGSQVEIIFQME
jgi:hypothetical protein